MLNGIDVSVWQGDIDWSKASKQIDFAILRAGYGSSGRDTKFEKNYTGCKNNGVPVGIYWYNYAKNVSAAKTEANACLAAIKGKQIEYPIWYDIEESSVLATGKNNVSAMAKAFCDTIAAAGYKVGIYSSKSGLQSYFTDEIKNNYYVWMANVGKNGVTLSTTSYSGKKDIWQYSWKGRIDGIKGDVDLDHCYTDFSSAAPSIKPADEKPATNTNKIDVYYKVYNGQKWYPEVKNTEDYAGVDEKTITGITARASKGILKYRVHSPSGKWFDWVEKSDSNDWVNGIAGSKKKSIDGFQMKYDTDGYKVYYRVSLIGSKNFLPWVEEDTDYAGVFGKLIDKIQIKIEKK